MKTVKLKMMTNAQEKISDLLQPLLECAEQKRNIDEWNDHATKLLEELDSLLSKQLEELVEKVEGLKSVELPDGQIIISKDQVIALIKDTNEVAEEEEENK